MQKIDDYSLIILFFASLLLVLETCTDSEQQCSAVCLSPAVLQGKGRWKIRVTGASGRAACSTEMLNTLDIQAGKHACAISPVSMEIKVPSTQPWI